MLRPAFGTLTVNGQAAPSGEKELARLRNEFFGFIHQDYAVIEDLSVWANVAIPLEYVTSKIPRRGRYRKAFLELENMDSPKRSIIEKYQVCLGVSTNGSPSLEQQSTTSG